MDGKTLEENIWIASYEETVSVGLVVRKTLHTKSRYIFYRTSGTKLEFA